MNPLADLRGRPDLVGPALRRALVAAADGWLAELVGDPGPDVALVAVGGYGRGEPAFGSDLDLVLLHARPRTEVALVADRVWYPVWDAGVGLDHSVRTVDEAVAVAHDDLKAALGLLDARHVAGDPELTDALRGRVRALWRTTAPQRLPELRAVVEERAATFGEVAFLLEPDLKESRGGIRDVHALQALAAAQLADSPGPAVREAHRVLLDTRGELHRRGGRRPTDRLLLQEQDAVAETLGYADADALLQAVSAAGRTVAYASDTTWHRVTAALAPRRRRLLARRAAPGPERRPLARGVVEQGGEVVLARDADPSRDPVLVLRAAGAAARAGLPLGPHALERLRAESAPLPEPWPAEARDALVALLGAGAAAVPVIESLDQHGLVERLLPEWSDVRSKPQRNAYHRFTVDRHLVEAAAGAAALTRRVARPDLLLLGALLHDIGKGQPGDHTDNGVALVARIGPRLGLRPADVDVLALLVRHHLLLADTAVRRDLDDPATLRLLADAVGDRDSLELLHALTEADSRATGTAVWSDWKAGLVAEAVRRTARLLEGAPVPVPPPMTAEQSALVDAGATALHVRPVDGALEVTVVAADRPGLLSAAAGVLALHRLDVRAARAGARGGTGWVVLTVTPRYGSEPLWEVVRDDLRRAVEGRLDLGERLAAREAAYPADPGVAPPRVLWVDDASAHASVLEVRAADASGLLHRVTGALQRCGLDVRAARVATLGAEVVDAFYVTRGGARVAADGRAEVEEAVLRALGPRQASVSS